MSVEVNIDIASLGVNDVLSPQLAGAIQLSVEQSLAVVRDKWQTTAQSKLHSTLPLYLQGLQFDSIMYPYGRDAFSGAVQLNGRLPNMLEEGTSPFDIKIGFSKSDRKITKKNGGWYLTVPIRHSTPGAFMYGSPMPQDVYNQAKKLPNGGVLSFPGAGDVSWNGYQRKNTKYDGLTRIVKSYQKATQSTYVTFRRVSDKTDPMAWWHPGFVGRKIAESLEPFAKDTFVKALTNNISKI